MINGEEKSEYLFQQDIPSFYEDASVLITGGTGFVGQVLISKLMCSCPNIRKIYVIVRAKKGKSIGKRFEELLDNVVFEKMKTCCPDYLTKLIPIEGDCLEPNLGLSDANISLLLEKVNIIFHAAAAVNFEEKLRDAIYINIRTTNDLLHMAKNMKNLKVFVHISTAFTFCGTRKVIEEKMYEPPMLPQHALSLVDIFDDEMLEKITPSLLGPFLNTYIFTKAIAEWLCLDKNLGVPIAILRPSIISSTAEDPVPGWVNNVYGPNGILAAAGIGLLRTMNTDENVRANIIPCDYLVNAIIAAAWYTASTWTVLKKNADGTPQILVFNYTSTELKNAITWKVLKNAYQTEESKMPSSQSMGVCWLILNKYKFVHKICTILFHIIPAIIVDGIAAMFGEPTKLMQTYSKLHKFLDALSYFSTRDWTMFNDNVTKMWYCLSEHDKQIFKFNIHDLDWTTYFKNYVWGIRFYIIKEGNDTISTGLKKRKVLKLIFWSVVAAFTFLFTYFCCITFRRIFK